MKINGAINTNGERAYGSSQFIANKASDSPYRVVATFLTPFKEVPIVNVTAMNHEPSEISFTIQASATSCAINTTSEAPVALNFTATDNYGA